MTNQSHTELAAHGGNTGPGLPLLARLYTQGRYTRASVDRNHPGQPLTSLSNAAEWRQIAILRWQMIEDLTRERDALAAALESPEQVLGEVWPADLSSSQRTQPERFAVINRDNGEPVIDDDDFKFDALIVVHGDFGDGEKEKYVAEVCRRLNAATPSPQAERVPLSDEQIDAAWDQFWAGTAPLTSIEARRGWARHVEAIVTKESSNGVS